MFLISLINYSFNQIINIIKKWRKGNSEITKGKYLITMLSTPTSFPSLSVLDNSSNPKVIKQNKTVFPTDPNIDRVGVQWSKFNNKKSSFCSRKSK